MPPIQDMSQQSISPTRSEDNANSENIDSPAPSRAMTDGSIPTGFVASRVNSINMATPNASTVGTNNSTHRSAARYRRRSETDRSSLPSQAENGPPRTSLSRYRPVVRGREVSTPANVPATSVVVQEEAHRRVSTPLPAPYDSSLSRGEGFSNARTSENRDLNEITVTSPPHFLGHRRNRTVVSDIGRPSLGSDLSSQIEVKSSTPSPACTSDIPEVQNDHASSSKEDLLIFPEKAFERRTSTDSLNSTSTVESDSWNPVPTNGPEPDRPLRRVAKFNLETGSFSQTPLVPILENLRIEEARGMYPIESVQYGGAADGCHVYDFAYPGGSEPKRKHVRFASKSDHAPSVKYNSSSESGASTKAVCGTGRTAAEDDEEDDDWMQDERDIRVDGTTLPMHRYQANTPGDEIESGPAIRHNPLLREVEIKSRRSTAPSSSGIQEEGDSDDGLGVPLLPSQSREISPSTSADSQPRVLRKTRTGNARRPLPSNAGILNRDFTFPPHDTVNRAMSMPLLNDSPPISPHSYPENVKTHHRRSSSFAKLLQVFTRKGAKDKDGGEGHHKKTGSFAGRIRKSWKGSFSRKSRDKDGNIDERE